MNGINNPVEAVDTNLFLIEVISDILDDKKYSQFQISSSNSLSIPKEQFLFEGGTIIGAQLQTSNPTVAQFEDNVATFTFEPAFAVPFKSGKIEIETPIWASVYDSQLEAMKDLFPGEEPSLSCSSQSFEELSTSSESNFIVIDYKGLTQGQQDQIEISCAGFRNPIEPEVVSGFIIRTYDVQSNIIDESEPFSLDSSVL